MISFDDSPLIKSRSQVDIGHFQRIYTWLRENNPIFSKMADIPNCPMPIIIEDDNSNYFTPRVNSSNSKGCYTVGSVSPEPGMKWACQCKQGYYGSNCAIPEVVMTSVCLQTPYYCSSFKVRDKPRRIVHFFNVHHEFDHVEIQLGELDEVVDIFVIGESNRTTSGEAPNELKFLPKMKDEGLYKDYQHKIIHVTIPSTDFPNDPTGGGWITDAFIRNYMGEKGISRIDG